MDEQMTWDDILMERFLNYVTSKVRPALIGLVVVGSVVLAVGSIRMHP